MPNLALQIKCTLVGVTELKPAELEFFRWYLKLRCTNCGEAPEHWQYITINEFLEVPGGRSHAQLVEKCKLCSRVNTMSILPDFVQSYKYENNEKWQTVIVFDCRGIEPFDFDPRIGWQATSVKSNQIFDEIDLSEKMWADYDERANEAVEISNFESQFVHYKSKK